MCVYSSFPLPNEKKLETFFSCLLWHDFGVKVHFSCNVSLLENDHKLLLWLIARRARGSPEFDYFDQRLEFKSFTDFNQLDWNRTYCITAACKSKHIDCTGLKTIFGTFFTVDGKQWVGNITTAFEAVFVTKNSTYWTSSTSKTIRYKTRNPGQIRRSLLFPKIAWEKICVLTCLTVLTSVCRSCLWAVASRWNSRAANSIISTDCHWTWLWKKDLENMSRENESKPS